MSYKAQGHQEQLRLSGSAKPVSVAGQFSPATPTAGATVHVGQPSGDRCLVGIETGRVGCASLNAESLNLIPSNKTIITRCLSIDGNGTINGMDLQRPLVQKTARFKMHEHICLRGAHHNR